jgi:hypothetical protein
LIFDASVSSHKGLVFSRDGNINARRRQECFITYASFASDTSDGKIGTPRKDGCSMHGGFAHDAAMRNGKMDVRGGERRVAAHASYRSDMWVVL